MATAWDTGGTGGAPRWVIVAVLAGLTVVGGLLARTLDQRAAPVLPVETWQPERADRDDDVDAPVQQPQCPPDSPVVVINDVAYPPGHPDLDGAEPSLCLPDLQAARALGLRRAPSPAGTEYIAGVFLVPDDGLFPQCRRHAAYLRHPLPCPARLPHGGSTEVCLGTCITGGGYLLSVRGFTTPPDWCGGCYPDLLIAAAPVDAPAVVRGLARCHDGALGQRRGTFFCDVPVGPSIQQSHAGHTMRHGRRNGILFAVSAHGRGPNQNALVNSVFEGLTILGG